MNTLFIIIAIMALMAVLVGALCARTKNGLTVFANIAEGTHEGNITKKADAAIATRFFLVEIGSDIDHVAASNSASDIPLGICTDESAAAEDLVNVALLGSSKCTLKAVANAAITAGAFITSAGNGKVQTLSASTGTYYIIGRALIAAAADGDVIEFDPCLPVQRVVA